MAKDFLELKARVDYYTDDAMAEDTAMMLFNECSEDLSAVSGYTQIFETPLDKDVPTFQIPADFIEAIELRVKKDVDYLRILPIGVLQPQDTLVSNYVPVDSGVGYELFGDTIEVRFSNNPYNGTLQLRYFANLPSVESLSQVPAVKTRFHDAYALFAAAKYYQNYQDELQAKNDYWGEYQAKRFEIEKEFLKVKSRMTSKTVYQMRRWS